MYSSAAAQGFDPVHDTPEPREVEAFRAAVLSKLRYNVAKEPSHARDHDWLLAVSLAARDHVIDRWSETTRRTYRDGRKRVYYFSLEFLVGRMLFDALSNLGLAATAIAHSAASVLGLPGREHVTMTASCSALVLVIAVLSPDGASVSPGFST